MNHPDRDRDYLRHILEAIDRIQTYTSGKSKVVFLSEPLLQDAVIRNVEVIGETANRLSPEFITMNLQAAYDLDQARKHRKAA